MTDRAELMVPIVPTNGTDIINLNLHDIFIAENRAQEVATVNQHKAPELLALFNRAYLDLSNMLSQLRFQQTRAEDCVAKRKAVLLVDIIPGQLKEKGLASSADVRQALIDLDEEYQRAKERLDFIEATIEYIKGKIKFMENAYTSVKKIMGENAYNMGRADLDGLIDEGKTAGHTQMRSIFGDPK